MTDFLLELRSEEIPARMQAKAREDLARLFAAELARDGLVATELVTYATPRRLALIAKGLPEETAPTRHETKGPRINAPAQALEGFLRRYQLTIEQLEPRDGVYFAVRLAAGRPTSRVLAEAVENVIRAFPWPKSMRWGAASASTESLRWVRPLQGIVALLGDEVVPFAIAGPPGSRSEADSKIASGAATLGHRFHHPGVITIGGAHDYVEKLRACHVVVDQDERAAIIRARAGEAAAAAGLTLVEDEGLVAENAGLTEWPVPLLGRFDAAFLDVPPEVIQLTARVNQKYFVCRSDDGTLANAFVCTANIEAADGGARIVEGNRKVLAARLADARFFYETDLKVPLAAQAAKLDRIVFHEKLGTVADKVERVVKLARWLVEEGIVKGADPDLAERAARLAKADLVTGMVGEFPELQGLMGGYYAAVQGEPREVAEAIRDHYKPVGQGDEVPTAPVTVAVSLADKLDTLNGFFGVGEVPTGSRDPFALRRAALGVVRMATANALRLPLLQAYVQSLQPYVQAYVYRASKLRADMDAHSLSRAGIDPAQAFDAAYISRMLDEPEVVKFAESFGAGADVLLDFFADRLKVQQREAGVRHDLIDAIFAAKNRDGGGEDDLVRLLARVRALQAFVGTEDGANLLAGYKRAANILKKEGFVSSVPVNPAKAGVQMPHVADADGHRGGNDGDGVRDMLAYAPEPAEAALAAALDAAEPAAVAAVAREDFTGAMAALATLRAPIDAFFDAVTVNDADPAKRAGRLTLLDRVRGAVHGVADFSRIEG